MRAYVLLLMLFLDAVAATIGVHLSSMAWGVGDTPFEVYGIIFFWIVYFGVAFFFTGLTYYVFKPEK